MSCPRSLLVLAFLLAGGLGGCGMMGGTTGLHKPQYVLPKEKRVLVFVDVHPTVTAPAGFAPQLGDAIANQLFKYKAIEHPVGQARLNELRVNPDKFQAMGIADIEKATDADVVVYVELITFNVTKISDGSLTQGLAQALVKVIDSSGHRLWPKGDVAGAQVDVNAAPVFTESRDTEATARELNLRLARDVGRIFRDWYRNENGMQNE